MDCTFSIYVLRLEGGKYYVGKTGKRVEERFDEHLAGQGSEWTRRYKPLEIVKAITTDNRFEEDNQVKTYMTDFGIDNVRGGAYAKPELSSLEKEKLLTEIRHAADSCLLCGSPDHYQYSCPKRYKQSSSSSPFSEDSPQMKSERRCRGVTLRGTPCQSYLYINSDGYCASHQGQHEPNRIISREARPRNRSFPDSPLRAEEAVLVPGDGEKCCLGMTQQGMRCRSYKFLNRHGYCPQHKDQQTANPNFKSAVATAETWSSGYHEVSSRAQVRDCRRCGRHGHDEKACYANTHVNGYILASSNLGPSKRQRIQTSTLHCHRCGRSTHGEDNCFATKHVDGYSLSQAATTGQRMSSSRQGCWRCGRTNHREDSCYATKHVDGSFLF